MSFTQSCTHSQTLTVVIPSHGRLLPPFLPTVPPSPSSSFMQGNPSIYPQGSPHSPLPPPLLCPRCACLFDLFCVFVSRQRSCLLVSVLRRSLCPVRVCGLSFGDLSLCLHPLVCLYVCVCARECKSVYVCVCACVCVSVVLLYVYFFYVYHNCYIKILSLTKKP